MCFSLTLNTNNIMQYSKPVPQGKSNSSLEIVTFPWIIVSGYNFKIMNTLHEFAANPAQCSKNLQRLSNKNFKAAC